MNTFCAETTLTTISCCCGGVYAIQERYRQEKLREGGDWLCPYCRTGWGYSGKGENAQLKKQLADAEQLTMRERQRHDQTKAELRDTENRRRAECAAKTRLKNRVGNGVCPCCHRTLKDLSRHMKSKHPNYLANRKPTEDQPCET